MVKTCKICGTKLDGDICSYCGLDNSGLSDKDNERCYIILWALFTVISVIAAFLTRKIEPFLCLAITNAAYFAIMTVGAVVQHVTKVVFATNIACLIATISIPIPLILMQPDFSGGYGGLVYVVYLMIPAIIISFIGNYVSYKRKLHL